MRKYPSTGATFSPEESHRWIEGGKFCFGEMTINFSGLSKTAEQWNYLTICMHFSLSLSPSSHQMVEACRRKKNMNFIAHGGFFTTSTKGKRRNHIKGLSHSLVGVMKSQRLDAEGVGGWTEAIYFTISLHISCFIKKPRDGSESDVEECLEAQHRRSGMRS